jgi:hypothetical protein
MRPTVRLGADFDHHPRAIAVASGAQVEAFEGEEGMLLASVTYRIPSASIAGGMPVIGVLEGSAAFDVGGAAGGPPVFPKPAEAKACRTYRPRDAQMSTRMHMGCAAPLDNL